MITNEDKTHHPGNHKSQSFREIGLNSGAAFSDESVQGQKYVKALEKVWQDPEEGWSEFSRQFSEELSASSERSESPKNSGREAIDDALREAINHAELHNLRRVDAVQAVVRGVLISAPLLGKDVLYYIRYVIKRAIKSAIQSGEEAYRVLGVSFQSILYGLTHAEADISSQYAAGIRGARECCKGLTQEEADTVLDWIEKHPSA